MKRLELTAENPMPWAEGRTSTLSVCPNPDFTEPNSSSSSISLWCLLLSRGGIIQD